VGLLPALEEFWIFLEIRTTTVRNVRGYIDFRHVSSPPILKAEQESSSFGMDWCLHLFRALIVFFPLFKARYCISWNRRLVLLHFESADPVATAV